MSRKTRPDKRSSARKKSTSLRFNVLVPRPFDFRVKTIAWVLLVSVIAGVMYASWLPAKSNQPTTDTAGFSKNDAESSVKNLSTFSQEELAALPPEALRPRRAAPRGYNASQGGFPPGALLPGVVLPGITDDGRTTAQGYGVYDGIRQQFTGQERDNETGLDYFHARYYSATQGRFTSVDPGNAGADPSNPQSWNGYAYALNNPILYTDPDGLKVRVCDREGQCAEISDADAANGLFNKDYQKSIGGVVRDGRIYLNGELVGTYQRTSFDDWSDQANAVFFGNRDTAGLVARAPVIEQGVAVFAGAGVVGGVTGGVGLYALGAGSTVTTLGLGAAAKGTTGTQLAGLSISQLNLLIRGTQKQLLNRLFGQGMQGAQEALGTGAVPAGLTRQTLLVYREIARRAIQKGIDKGGVQAARLKIIEEALKKVK